jgi:hypothetical protein
LPSQIDRNPQSQHETALLIFERFQIVCDQQTLWSRTKNDSGF